MARGLLIYLYGTTVEKQLILMFHFPHDGNFRSLAGVGQSHYSHTRRRNRVHFPLLAFKENDAMAMGYSDVGLSCTRLLDLHRLKLTRRW